MKIVKNKNTKAVFVVRDNSSLLNDEDFFEVSKESYDRLCDFANASKLRKLSIKNEIIIDNHNIAKSKDNPHG